MLSLQDYDEIVHIPMSSGLSGSCETAIMLSQDYDGRVQVVNNQRISVTQRQSVLDAKELAGKGYSAEAIKEILEREKMESSIYIMVDTLYYLKKADGSLRQLRHWNFIKIKTGTSDPRVRSWILLQRQER